MQAQLLKDKVAIITGGSKGIGRAAAELFVREGAKVVITARGKDALDATVAEVTEMGFPGTIVGMQADSSKPEDVNRVVADTVALYGRVDILVNNAGVSNRWSIESSDAADWERIMDINVIGPMHFIKAVLPGMLERESGSIVNVGSLAGIRYMSGTAYTTSKAAIVGLTKSIAFRGAGSGVRCNCVCPGHVETPMAKATAAALAGNEGKFAMSEITNKYVNRDPKLNAHAEQVANAILYFASDMATDVTAQVLAVDPGMFL